MKNLIENSGEQFLKAIFRKLTQNCLNFCAFVPLCETSLQFE